MNENYRAVIKMHFDLLERANLADTEFAEKWQRPVDAIKYFGALSETLVLIAGSAIVEHWCATNEIDYELADRNA